MKTSIKIFFYSFLLFTFNSHKVHSQLDSDFRVNDDTTIRTQYAAKIGVDSLGNFTVVWQDQRNNRPNVYCQRFDSVGHFRGNNFRINSIPDSSGRPSIAVTISGTISICWLEINSTIPNSSKIKFRIFSNEGIPTSAEKILNDTIGNFTGSPSMGVNNNYEYFIAWNQNGVLYQKVDSNGKKIGNNIKVNDNIVFAGQGDPAITVRTDGSYIITWHDTRPPAGVDSDDIYFQMFDKFGNRIGANQKVNDDVSNFNLQLSPKISSDISGRFVIAWYDDRLNNSHSEIYAQNYLNDGSKFGINYRVSESSTNYDKGICNIFKKENGEFLIGWTESRPFISSPYFQRYDSSGIKIGNNFLVSNQLTTIDKIYSDLIIHNNKIISVWNDERNDPFDIYCNIRSYTNPDTTVNIIQTSSSIPENFLLYQNYPNPFNPVTHLEFRISKLGFVSLKVYDILGKEVKTLVNEVKPVGIYKVLFDGSNLPSGVYFYKIEAGDFLSIKKMMLLK